MLPTTPYNQLSSLIWGLRTCQSKLPHEVDSATFSTLFAHHRGLGFYSFLSETDISGKTSITRFFSAGSKDEPMLRAALESALAELRQKRPSGADDFVFLDPNETEAIETTRLGKKRRLRALAVKTSHRPTGGQELPLRMAILVDVGSPAFNEGSAYWVPLAAEIDSALHARDSMFLHFPPAYSEYLWRAASKRCGTLQQANDSTREKQHGVLARNTKLDTVTVSLDLRQSTFAMEKVISRDVFSKWMEGLVRAYRNLIYSYHGVFDKFTGDGVLAHFLDPDALPGGSSGDSQTRRGVRCAMDMVTITGIFFDRLQPNLRIDSKLFGAGVGIAADHANWSMDGARNPMVVGHGVVDACRLCARAEAGETLITVNAYHRLCLGSSPQDTKAEKIDFSGKNYPDEMELMVWRLQGCGPDFSKRFQQLEKLALDELKNIPALESPCSVAHHHR